eukprot:Gregarina_sp_Poly_1__2152@NODE_1570_length_3820_cov_121_200639_g1037_i0_p1_GENE_NODE_1570_length_3820_cov_121_200639_g1037_i0NODE_1570_length_3820_cov_121_200639_g1037_i0_p1_ORF_typecomplete_len632_score112_51_NODE_1570_length_3820_cov_121_200639_g1037_i011593054
MPMRHSLLVDALGGLLGYKERVRRQSGRPLLYEATGPIHLVVKHREPRRARHTAHTKWKRQQYLPTVIPEQPGADDQGLVWVDPPYVKDMLGDRRSAARSPPPTRTTYLRDGGFPPSGHRWRSTTELPSSPSASRDKRKPKPRRPRYKEPTLSVPSAPLPDLKVRRPSESMPEEPPHEPQAVPSHAPTVHAVPLHTPTPPSYTPVSHAVPSHSPTVHAAPSHSPVTQAHPSHTPLVHAVPSHPPTVHAVSSYAPTITGEFSPFAAPLVALATRTENSYLVPQAHELGASDRVDEQSEPSPFKSVSPPTPARGTSTVSPPMYVSSSAAFQHKTSSPMSSLSGQQALESPSNVGSSVGFQASSSVHVGPVSKYPARPSGVSSKSWEATVSLMREKSSKISESSRVTSPKGTNGAFSPEKPQEATEAPSPKSPPHAKQSVEDESRKPQEEWKEGRQRMDEEMKRKTEELTRKYDEIRRKNEETVVNDVKAKEEQKRLEAIRSAEEKKRTEEIRRVAEETAKRFLDESLKSLKREDSKTKREAKLRAQPANKKLEFRTRQESDEKKNKETLEERKEESRKKEETAKEEEATKKEATKKEEPRKGVTIKKAVVGGPTKASGKPSAGLEDKQVHFVV